MVTVTISPAGRPPALAPKLPITLVLGDKALENATVADVKEAIAAQFPRVRVFASKHKCPSTNLIERVVLSGTSETLSQG